MQIAVGIGAGGFVDDDSRHFGIQASGDKALMAAHAGAHHDDGLAVPIRAARNVVDGARVAEIHVEKVGRFPVGVADCLILGADTGRLAGREVVRIHVESQPAFRRAIGNRVGLEGMHSGPLEYHERRELSFLSGLSEVALNVGTEAVELDRVQFHARAAGLGGREDGADRDGGESFQFGVPEGIEIGRTRN